MWGRTQKRHNLLMNEIWIERGKQMKYLVGAILIVLMVLVDTFQPQEDINVKHTMREGETLWNVVSDTMKETKDPRTIGEVVDETRTLNDLQGMKLANLQSGRIIVIPCKRNKWF